jgi:hypothetical protein
VKLRVEASVTDDDPTVGPMVGYFREEIVIPTEDTAMGMAMHVGQRLLDWLEEAQSSIGAQTEAAQKNVDQLKRDQGP